MSFLNRDSREGRDLGREIERDGKDVAGSGIQKDFLQVGQVKDVTDGTSNFTATRTLDEPNKVKLKGFDEFAEEEIEESYTVEEFDQLITSGELESIEVDLQMVRTRDLSRSMSRDTPLRVGLLTQEQRKEIDKIHRIKTINNTKYEIESFHPLAFEKGVFTVRFHEKGKPFLDKFSKDTMVKANNSREAINIAQKELFQMVRKRNLSRNTSRNIQSRIVNKPKSLFHGEPKFVKNKDIIKLKNDQELEVISGGSEIKFIKGEIQRVLAKNTITAKDSFGNIQKVKLNEIQGVL